MMTVDQIEDMLVAFTSNDPVERVAGLNALALFLYRLQPLPPKETTLLPYGGVSVASRIVKKGVGK